MRCTGAVLDLEARTARGRTVERMHLEMAGILEKIERREKGSEDRRLCLYSKVFDTSHSVAKVDSVADSGV